jgi:Tfp pilus assembly protein PilO
VRSGKPCGRLQQLGGALGVGMEGRMKTMINLLPNSFRRQQILRKRVIQWCSIISVVLVCGWAWHWYEMREDRELRKQLETLNREHAPTRTMLKELVAMRQQLVEMQQQESVAKELDCQRNALTLLGVISDTAKKTQGRLRLTKFDLTNFQDPRSGSGAAAAAKPPALILNGTSLDIESVYQLITGLKDSKVFSSVNLATLKEREDKNGALRDYEVRCEF